MYLLYMYIYTQTNTRIVFMFVAECYFTFFAVSLGMYDVIHFIPRLHLNPMTNSDIAYLTILIFMGLLLTICTIVNQWTLLMHILSSKELSVIVIQSIGVIIEEMIVFY